MPDSSTKTMARGALHYFLGYAGKLAGPIFLALAGRFYGESQLGVYLAAMATLEIAVRLSAGGLLEGASITMARHFEEKNGRFLIPEVSYRYLSNAFYVGISLSLLGVLFIWTGLPWVQRQGWTHFRPEMVDAMKILALGIPFQFLTQMGVTSTRALLKAKYDMLLNSFLRELGPLGFSLAFLAFSAMPLRLAWAQLLSYALSATVAIWVMRKYYSFGTLIRWRSLDLAFLAFCLPLTINDVFLALVQDLDLIMLAASGTISTLELAFYGVAVHIVFTMRMFRLNFMRILVPLASRLYAQGSHDEISNASRTSVRWILYLVLPFLGTVTLARQPLLSVYSPEYLPFADCLLILAVGPLVNAVFGINASLMVALGKPMLNLINNSFAVVLNLILNIALIPRYGIYGAATATASSMILAQLLIGLQTRHWVAGIWRFGFFKKPLLAFLLAFLPVFVIRIWVPGLIAQAALAVMFCCGFYLLLAAQGLEPEDVEGFPWLGNLAGKLHRPSFLKKPRP